MRNNEERSPFKCCIGIIIAFIIAATIRTILKLIH